MSCRDLFFRNPHNLFLNTESVTSSINATSTSTGALVVNGGCGISKDLYVGGNIYAHPIINVDVAGLNYKVHKNIYPDGTVTIPLIQS